RARASRHVGALCMALVSACFRPLAFYSCSGLQLAFCSGAPKFLQTELDRSLSLSVSCCIF
uniref:Uncharacterized protein n=1 Tax=Oryza brachyantha TaxID=4533 RepID=J3MF32_ORYBR